jgi:hypothetical protein
MDGFSTIFIAAVSYAFTYSCFLKLQNFQQCNYSFIMSPHMLLTKERLFSSPRQGMLFRHFKGRGFSEHDHGSSHYTYGTFQVRSPTKKNKNEHVELSRMKMKNLLNHAIPTLTSH